MKRVAMIGAGYTGMSAAESLCGNYKVDIYEKSALCAGMAVTFDFFGTPLERFYRHIFKSDTYVTDLAKRLGMGDEFDWPLTRMGYFSGGKIYEFGTPLSLLGFRPLPFIHKLRFGLSVLMLKGTKDYKSLEGITAYEWLIRNAGETAFKVIWEPLLKLKFGADYQKVAMSWLWGKIALRSSSGSADGEHLGYCKGSYGRLSEALEKSLLQRGVSFHFQCAVEKISKNANGMYVLTTQTGETKEYDAVICTIAYPEILRIAQPLLSVEEQEKLQMVRYTSTRCMVLSLKQSFMPFYWMNNGDKDIPFGGLIEHTRLISPQAYGGRHILYISNYLFSNEVQYHCSQQDLLDEYIPHLQKINPAFDATWIDGCFSFSEQYAQPIISTNYSSKMLPIEMASKGLFVASMPQIYPEDRGLNYAIRIGRSAAKKLEAQGR